MRHLISITNARNGEVLRVYPFASTETLNLFWHTFKGVCMARINGMGKPATATCFKENDAVIIGEKFFGFPVDHVQPYIVIETHTDGGTAKESSPQDVVSWAILQANQVINIIDE